VKLLPAQLVFNAQKVGSESPVQWSTLLNDGLADLFITSISISGDFAQSYNNCGNPGGHIWAQGSCTFGVTFKPTAAGSRTGAVTITDNAPGSPHVIELSGTGATGPLVTLSPEQLAFATQNAGSESAVKSVTVSNAGVDVLSITSISAGGDFAQTNNCGSTVAVGASCAIAATFKPTAGGTRTGTLTITDNAPGSPHVAALSGTGADFAISVPAGGDMTTVSAGQTASFNLSVSPAGFSGNVNFTCSGAPPAATCAVNPATVAISGNSPLPIAVTVSTAARSATVPWLHGQHRPGGGALAAWFSVLGLPVACCCASKQGRTRKVLLGTVVLLLLAVMMAGCGFEAAHHPPSVQTGTPAGTYTITVAATSGSLTHNMTLTVIVN
jgi:hypothetical protein